MPGSDLISANEAIETILRYALPLTPGRVALLDAAGLASAEDIFSPVDNPNFNQSSMDGYAFSFKDWKRNHPIKIVGEMAAGTGVQFELTPGTAARIFTGAPIPDGADTVVMQEKTRIEEGLLFIEDTALQSGSNIRAKGAEIKLGQLALKENRLITPAAVGFLAGIGITHISVYPQPKISIIVTGNELQTPGEALQHGQVYESNSWSLQAALHQMNIREINLHRVEDTLGATVDTLNKALAESDVICLTGGVSVGDYDFVAAAAGELGVEKVFHKIKQKPGKPFYFGKKGNKLVFGLPGNPASVMSCFYMYVEPALKKIARLNSAIRSIRVPLSTGLKKAPGLTHFLKGFYDGQSAVPLTAQES
ncbi:MAG TPA: molybdopterin molybdotransferase MoeA, partial [Chitinophagaceae bacterium]|nr:molybdopterin molybdotransferase MoeA [Chitinophagaceae bacterium]